MRRFQCWIVLVIGLVAQAAPLWAQEAIPLTLDETVSGQITNSVAYTFDLPAGEDAVVVLDADHVVLPSYCLSVEGVVPQCPTWGGGGDGDPPISRTFVIPGRDDTTVNALLRLSRPLDGAAQYTLTVYAVAAETVALGSEFAGQPAANMPFQLYAITADAAIPFSVTAASSTDDSFLWAAFEPYKLLPDFASEDPLLLPLQLDYGAIDAHDALELLQLYYLGSDTFHVLVKATKAYSLSSAPIGIPMIDAAQAQPVSLSYREPLKVVRLNSADAGAIVLTVEVTEGGGAFLWIYAQEQEYAETYALGIDAQGRYELPLSRTFPLESSGAERLVAMQIPFIYTRDPVVVSVEWQAQE